MGLTLLGGGTSPESAHDPEARALAQDAMAVAEEAKTTADAAAPASALPPLQAAATTASTLSAQAQAEHARLDGRIDGKADTPHQHAQSDVTGLSAALAAKVGTDDPRLTDSRTPTSHTHPQSSITNLTTDLAAKVATTDPRLNDARTPTAHAHTQADITGLEAALAAKAPVLPVEVVTLAFTAATAPAAASAAVGVECFSASKATRRKVDLTNATQIRLVVMPVANGNAAGAAVKVSYATTEAATWSGTDTGCSVVLGTGTAGVLRDSGWIALPAGAKANNVTLAVLVSAAFGATAPTVGSVSVYVK